MFTGIVEEAGVVDSIAETANRIRLVIECGNAASGLKIGDSMAVNGCCLTTVQVSKRRNQRLVHFDLLRETWDRTNLQFVQRRSLVNLERPLRANGRLDGHFVTGHIDGLGEIVRYEQSGSDHLLAISAPTTLMRNIVFKGSIALDGMSLTIASVAKKSFTVWIIPHTWEVTTLRERKPGDFVNLETDLLGKYVEKFLEDNQRTHG
jgi:riboflavin synthase